MKPLQLVDLQAQYEALRPALEAAVAGVLAGGRFVGGPHVEELERELARYAGAAAAVCVASGTDALKIPLIVAGVGPGDAVFVPSFTFVATAEVAACLGAEPVFVDVDAHSFTMDPGALDRAIHAVAAEGRLRPRAVIPVDLYGHPADYPALAAVAEAHGLMLLADAAQSFGAAIGARRVGTLAPVTATSFYPSKPLGCYGDGGCILLTDESAALAMRRVREHGLTGRDGEAVCVGLNSRLDTLQAAILREKLRAFPEELTRREQVAGWYRQRLDGRVGMQAVRPSCRSAWAVYAIMTAQHARVQAALTEAGISTARYYERPIHMQSAYRRYGRPGSLPVTERLCTQTLALPMHAYLSEQDVARICDIVADALG